MIFDGLKKEDRIGVISSIALHLLLVGFALWYTVDISARSRASYIDVTLGEFKSGMPAEFAEKQREKVAKQPNPSEVEQDEPEPEKPRDVEKKEPSTEETAKSADLPDQKEDVQEEPIKTPETKKVDPEKKEVKEKEEETEVPPKTEKGPVKQEGAEKSGTEKGLKGDKNADQGTGNEPQKSAPYELKWEGDIERTPVVRPLPDNVTNKEAVITVRFEVKPNGKIGRIQPLKKMNPELEREVMRTLRSWQFSDLPSGVPQESQWGVLTFRFVLE